MITMTRDEIQEKALEILKPVKKGGLAISMGVGKTRIGLRDLDECHSLLDSHRAFLALFNGRVIGLSGTWPRYSKSEKGKMVEDFCPLLYSYDVDDAVNDDILNDYKIIVHEIKLDHRNNIEVNTRSGGTFYTSESKNYFYWNNKLEEAVLMGNPHMARIKRMKVLKEFSSKEKYASKLADSIKEKCIIFANTQDQADRLAEHSYHSNNPDSEENLELFKGDQIGRLSCILQLSEGVNIPNLRQGIIMHAYGNERKSSQRLGRMLRLNPDDMAIVHILCYVDTIDKVWVEKALESYDPTKVVWKNFNIKLP
jgi:superfamily II DNA or RNA helicase